jgi:hypothetical protein
VTAAPLSPRRLPRAGPGAVTMDRAAEELGVTEPLAHRHFG